MNPANSRRGANNNQNYQNYRPNAPSGPSTQRLEQQSQADRERAQREAEEQLRRAEEERRQEFERDKRDALNSLKGISRSEIQIKGGTAFFGIKSNPDTVTLKTRGSGRTCYATCGGDRKRALNPPSPTKDCIDSRLVSTRKVT